MRPWKEKIDIKQHFIDDPDSPEKVRGVCAGILSELRKLRRQPVDIIEDWEDLAENATDVEEVDDALETLYDWADEQRVWLGIR